MKIAGLIFSNLHDSDIPRLTAKRTMGAVPFGGRYRLVDFPLSAMVNAGISNISIVAHHNYHSLMEHIGAGKDWDLARRRGGVRIVPPYSRAYAGAAECYDSRLQTLLSIRGLIDRLEEDTVLLSDCDTVATPDLSALIATHKAAATPMTIGVSQELAEGSMHIYVINVAYLRELLQEAEEKRYTSFTNDILRRRMARGEVATHRFDGRFYRIASFADYFGLHMLLVRDACVRRALLENEAFPIYTRAVNAPPVKYGKNAYVHNSLIAEGCVINGEVSNCVVFGGVHIGEHCVASGSILMENCLLAGNASVALGVVDKGACLGGSVRLHGHDSLPIFVEEGRKIV